MTRTQLFRWSMMALMAGMLCSSCATLDKDAPKDPDSNPFFVRQSAPTNEKNTPYFYKFKMIEVATENKSWAQEFLHFSRDNTLAGWATNASDKKLTKKQLKDFCSQCVDSSLKFKKRDSVKGHCTANATVMSYFYLEGSDKVFYKAKVVFVNGWPTRVE